MKRKSIIAVLLIMAMAAIGLLIYLATMGFGVIVLYLGLLTLQGQPDVRGIPDAVRMHLKARRLR